jgi:uncharacterized phage protein gp47/JayE
MAIDYGLTDSGFVPKTLDVILSELQTSFRGVFGEGVSLDASTPEGQIIGILAARESDLWDMAEEVVSARDPDQATGAAQSSLCAITGTVGPKAATKSQLSALTIGGVAGTVVPAGSQASVSGTGVKFSTKADATITTVSAWASSHAYSVGARATNGGNVYEAITAGTSASSGGPTGTATDITDGGAHWVYLGAGSGAADVAAEAVDTGPLVAPARTLTVIETPVGGWSWCSNAADAAAGADRETPVALRLRRLTELASQGLSAPDAVRAAVLQVSGVTACTVFENTTLSTDAFSRPAKSIEVLVSGGTDQSVLDAVFDAKPAGIETYGTTTGSSVDAQGKSHTVKFSRPSQVSIYVVVNLQKDPTTYPADGDAQVKAAIVAFGQANQGAGVDVVSFRIKRAITVSGVMDVPSLYIDTSASPTTETKVGITATQQANLDTSRIVVNATNYSDTP